jgi:hypothetical protein
VRFKVVPEPPPHRGAESDDTDPGEESTEDGEATPIEHGQRAIPLVPASEAECCARLADRLSLPARDAAREWLTFLRALGLVAETDSGFRRRREDPGPEDLAMVFRERVYGVQEVLAVLDESETPLPADTVIRRFAEFIPQWERFRYPDSEAIWGKRVERILGWAVCFGLAKRLEEGYRLADDS